MDIKQVCVPSPNRRPTINVLTSGDNDTTSDDLWSLVLSVDSRDKLENTKLIGPTYKTEILVEGVHTRALLDHGSKVIIVRRQ